MHVNKADPSMPFSVTKYLLKMLEGPNSIAI